MLSNPFWRYLPSGYKVSCIEFTNAHLDASFLTLWSSSPLMSLASMKRPSRASIFIVMMRRRHRNSSSREMKVAQKMIEWLFSGYRQISRNLFSSNSYAKKLETSVSDRWMESRRMSIRRSFPITDDKVEMNIVWSDVSPFTLNSLVRRQSMKSATAMWWWSGK